MIYRKDITGGSDRTQTMGMKGMKKLRGDEVGQFLQNKQEQSCNQKDKMQNR